MTLTHHPASCRYARIIILQAEGSLICVAMPSKREKKLLHCSSPLGYLAKNHYSYRNIRRKLPDSFVFNMEEDMCR